MRIDAELMWLLGGVMAFLAIATVTGMLLARSTRSRRRKENAHEPQRDVLSKGTLTRPSAFAKATADKSATLSHPTRRAVAPSQRVGEGRGEGRHWQAESSDPSPSTPFEATVQNLNARIRAWWMMVAIFGLALATGGLGSVVLFGLTSFWALREFITLSPTRGGDHRTLFWVFFVITPLHYYLLATRWYGLFVVLIPVYAFLFIPLRSAIAGDCERFLERTAKIQWGLMVCVYCVSHAPALLMLEIPGYENENAKLLFFFVLVVQISDVLQYVWGKAIGRHRIAPHVSPNKTVEGFLGGVASATLIGAALWWATPFTPIQAAGMSLVITLMGFAGGLVMSAIKRDRGVKDYGTLIEGHGGVMDRIDSLCFAAPVFFHLTRYYFT